MVESLYDISVCAWTAKTFKTNIFLLLKYIYLGDM